MTSPLDPNVGAVLSELSRKSLLSMRDERREDDTRKCTRCGEVVLIFETKRIWYNNRMRRVCKACASAIFQARAGVLRSMIAE